MPPYLISLAAARSGKQDDEIAEMLGEAEEDNVIGRMKAWMIDFVEKYGFWGVLLMSAWPNAAFDLVGICCGQLNVPFMTFFVATVIGKACIKVSGQAVFFAFWFRNVELVIDFAKGVVQGLPSWIPLNPSKVEKLMRDGLESVSTGKAKDKEAGLVKQMGEAVVGLVVFYFLYTTICQLAQQHQKDKDDKTIEKYEKGQIKKNL